MKFKRIIRIVVMFLEQKHLLKISDKLYLKVMYKHIMKKNLNLDNPQTFNEKLQWLKLYDRNPEYTKMVDKYEAKKYVADIIGEEYIIPTIGVYDKFDEIDFDKLPNQFVMKCTHDSGGLVIVRDKNKFNIKEAKKKINKCLKKNYYYSGREYPYKNVKPRIIVEKYMEDENNKELRDYKFYCFDGKCDYVILCFDRFKSNTKFFYYDRNWNLMDDFSIDGIKYGDDIKIEKPKQLNEMFEIAEKLSSNIPFVRMDLYNINNSVYFGEFTFYPSAGFDNTRTKSITKYLNKKLILRNGEKNENNWVSNK